MRLTIRQLAIAVGIAAILFSSLFSADSGLTSILLVVFLLSLLSRWRRYTMPWGPAVVALTVVSFSAGGEAPIGTFPVSFVAFVASALFFLMINIPVPRFWTGRFLALTAVSLLCIASVGLTGWPFRLAFLASRPEFEVYAARLAAGSRPTRPERVGLFAIRRFEVRDGRPCLWTGPGPGSSRGFVRNPLGGVNRALGQLPNTAFNSWWFFVYLDDQWVFIDDD